MADQKISQLTGATTPLAGTEVLPIVQSGVTKQVSIADVTAGRAVSALSYDTSIATAKVSVAGNTISGAGTDTNVPVIIDPKGTSNVIIPNSAGNAWSHMNGGNTAANGAEPWLASFNNATASSATFGWAFYNNDVNGNLDLFRRNNSTTGFAVLNFTRSNGDVTVAAGNLVIGTSGKGIDFSATAGTGTSELLADYEEGLCTLGIAFGGGTTGITYGGRPISYVKVGSLVTVVGYIGLSNKGSSTGSATITGLPFTTASSANGGFAAVTLSAANLSFVGQYSGYTAASGTTVNLYQTAATGTLSALTDANFANNTEIEFCIHYRSV